MPMSQKDMEDMLKSHESRLNAIDVAYAKIDLKLKLILGILAAIGTALCAALVGYLFNF